jgi:hypothetical protein
MKHDVRLCGNGSEGQSFRCVKCGLDQDLCHLNPDCHLDSFLTVPTPPIKIVSMLEFNDTVYVATEDSVFLLQDGKFVQVEFIHSDKGNP